MEIGIFTFNDFSENTYLIFDETNECIIIDPGCSNKEEEKILKEVISERGLKPVRLINTHCHIDHILGNHFVAQKYGLKLECHQGEIPVLQGGKMVSQMYGIPYTQSPEIEIFLEEGDVIEFGNTKLDVLFTPGHSPASISFYSAKEEVLIAGDVLFQGSIGRTDLPGGDHDTLLESVRKKFFTLPKGTRVFPGHGPSTTIGEEKKNNPFFK